MNSNRQLPDINTCTIAVIGLGYVGLPLANEFAKNTHALISDIKLSRKVIGFDIDTQRLTELKAGFDRTKEIPTEDLVKGKSLVYSNDQKLLEKVDVFIVTVPTPIDNFKRPDLGPLEKASSMVGLAIKARQQCSTNLPLVIYESTVYPGAIEEVCVPILEKVSGFSYNIDFVCGYSPERINPGDKNHRLTSIVKVTSGSTPDSSEWINSLYSSIIKAGTFQASSLKVAEAAKVIENTQRDLNIALVNELAMIFSFLNIDTLEVLEAAGTKWNFLPFRPGLVGGHCIGVDPYYLTHKAEQIGYYPQLVLAGRRINDGMATWIGERLVLEIARRGIVVNGSNVLVLGFSFKENCPDIRNTKTFDLISFLNTFYMNVEVVDPYVNSEEVEKEYGLKTSKVIPKGKSFDVIILAVAHNQFCNLTIKDWQDLLLPNCLIVDIKGIVPIQLKPLRF